MIKRLITMHNAMVFQWLSVVIMLLIAIVLEDSNVQIGLGLMIKVSRQDALELKMNVTKRLVSIQSYVKVYLVMLV